GIQRVSNAVADIIRVAKNGIEPLRHGTSTAINLFMLMCFAGRERTVAELTNLAAGCGLALRGTTEVAEGRTALEFAAAPEQSA
ncbi:hypothetical protein ABT262_50550, partial [Amycolatopsis mediterranei]